MNDDDGSPGGSQAAFYCQLKGAGWQVSRSLADRMRP